MIRSMSAARQAGARQRRAPPRAVPSVEVVSPSRGDVALPDAGALDDPFVGGVDRRREFGVGDARVRADRRRRRARRNGVVGHDAAFLDDLSRARERRRRASFARMARSSRGFWRAIPGAPCRSRPRSRRRKLSASAPPWLLMTTPSRPRNTPPLTRPGSILSPQRLEGAAREQIADARQPGSRPSRRGCIGRSAWRCLRRSSARYCR